jgi:hypothetical protein
MSEAMRTLLVGVGARENLGPLAANAPPPPPCITAASCRLVVTTHDHDVRDAAVLRVRAFTFSRGFAFWPA